MANTFTVNLPLGVGVEQMQQRVEEAGGIFAANGDEGRFKVKGVVGHFFIVGDHCTITIDRKPWLVPMKMIEVTVRSYLM